MQDEVNQKESEQNEVDGMKKEANFIAVSYTHLRAPRDRQKSRMPSSAC